MLKLGPGVLQDVSEASLREWLHCDGLGGYASSTVLGLNTRRYHGLLVAATQPPVGRMVLLSKLEETLILGGRRYELGVNAYPGAVHPKGFEWATEFALDPLPRLTWEIEGGRLSRTVARCHGEPGTVILYLYEGPAAAVLELRPFIAFRDHHALQKENASVRGDVVASGADVVLRPYDGCPALTLRVPGATFRTDAFWSRNFEYARERERGFDFTEDLFSHGVFTKPLTMDDAVGVLAYAGPIPPARDGFKVVQDERTRLRSQAGGEHGLVGDLRRAADAFLVQRGRRGRTIIAGYHWFADWGRDTMISLPGLVLSRGRNADARAILGELAGHVNGGMIPNNFPDGGQPPEYNTVDAALWMVLAVGRYLESSKDQDFVLSRLWGAVVEILEKYRAGTRHGIGMTPEGLITQGEAGLQLTWMDARVGDRVVTPRRGLAVEIQALWHNALIVGSELARLKKDRRRAAEWARLAALGRETFQRVFWSEDVGYLADVVEGGVADFSLRPNQLYAIGLPHALVSREKAVLVLSAVKGALLTPVGLRTLAPGDPAYRGRYAGDAQARDTAYHQGTVWPYLMGVYFDALIRVYGEEGKSEARTWLEDFSPHLREVGLGYLSEVFDGDAPHTPGGAIAQAWSVAEILRTATRVLGRPIVPASAASPPRDRYP